MTLYLNTIQHKILAGENFDKLMSLANILRSQIQFKIMIRLPLNYIAMYWYSILKVLLSVW